MTLPLPLAREKNTLDNYVEMKPTPGLGEVFSASFDLGTDDTFMGAYYNRSEIEELEAKSADIPKMSIVDLNEKYPRIAAERPFDTPMNFLVAETINEKFMDRKRLEGIIQRSLKQTSSPGLTKSAAFVGGVAPSVLDPVELGVGMAVGLGIGKVAQVAATSARFAAKFPRIATGITKYQGVPLTVGSDIAGDLIANTMAEIPISHMNNKLQRDYEIGQAFENAILGTVFSTGLKGAVKGIGKGIEFTRGKLDPTYNFNRFVEANLSPEKVERALTASIAQLNLGEHVNVRGILNEGRVKVGSDVLKYNFKRVTPADTKKTIFYGVRKQGAFSEQRYLVGEDIGNGYYFTDNPNVANAFNKNFDAISLKDTNLFDYNERITPGDFKLLRSILKETNLGRKRKILLPKDASYKDLITAIKEKFGGTEKATDLINDIHQIKASQGFDGVIHESTGKDFFSEIESPPPQNVVILFDPKKISVAQKLRPHNKLDGAQEVKSSRPTIEHFESDIVAEDFTREFNRVADVGEGFRPEARAAIRKKIIEQEDILKQAQKDGLLEGMTEKEIRDIDDQFKKQETQLQALKDAHTCAKGGF